MSIEKLKNLILKNKAFQLLFLTVHILLAIRLLTGDPNSAYSEKNYGKKPESQLTFEKKAKEIEYLYRSFRGATREAEKASTKKTEFWEHDVPGMKVEGWKCKNLDAVAPKIIKRHNWGRGIGYVVDCEDFDSVDIIEAFGRGKFTLWIPDTALNIPEKIYNGDVIHFSGQVTSASSLGLVKGHAKFNMNIRVTQFSIN